MAYREFTDQYGIEWRAWDVQPTSVERRNSKPNAGGQPPVKDERRRRENSGEVRLRMRPGWEGGWLSFESASEKRRLIPLPRDWDKASDDQLKAWLGDAKQFPKRGSFIE